MSRAMVAAKITKKLVECEGRMDDMMKIFKNKSKLSAIEAVWQRRNEWPEIRKVLYSYSLIHGSNRSNLVAC